MQAILYIGHGSRVTEAVDQATNFMNQVQSHIPVPIQEISFLELADPTIREGVEKCIKRGATRIAVVPVLLLTAGHAKKDIPEELDKVKKEYPHITFNYGSPIGIHDKVIDALEYRINEKSEPSKKGKYILLVGRGSSDQDQINDLREIASRLEMRDQIGKVETCFLAAASPSFEEGLEIANRTGNKQIFVLPYLLFTGILMKSMEKTIRTKKDDGTEYILCDYIGFHPYLQDALVEKIKDTIKLPKEIN